MKSCKLCKFFELVDEGKGRGECFRYPPSVVSNKEIGKFPVTSVYWWCGEYELKKVDLSVIKGDNNEA